LELGTPADLRGADKRTSGVNLDAWTVIIRATVFEGDWNDWFASLDASRSSKQQADYQKKKKRREKTEEISR